MNAEEASLLWNRKDDIEQAGGHARHRQYVLKHLKLKTVIKVGICVTLRQEKATALSLCSQSSPEQRVAACKAKSDQQPCRISSLHLCCRKVIVLQYIVWRSTIQMKECKTCLQPSARTRCGQAA